jgi:hypothetical protein
MVSLSTSHLFRTQTATVNFKKPIDSLAETTVAVRRTSDVSKQHLKWWCFLTHNRTVFEETPDV